MEVGAAQCCWVQRHAAWTQVRIGRAIIAEGIDLGRNCEDGEYSSPTRHWVTKEGDPVGDKLGGNRKDVLAEAGAAQCCLPKGRGEV